MTFSTLLSVATTLQHQPGVKVVLLSGARRLLLSFPASAALSNTRVQETMALFPLLLLCLCPLLSSAPAGEAEAVKERLLQF